MFRDRDPTSQALSKIFSRQLATYDALVKKGTIVEGALYHDTIKKHFDFGGEILLGHLRYGTSGSNDPDAAACHPFSRKSIWPTRNLMLAGNFNITNSTELNETLVKRGAHPIFSTDTQTLLEEIGFWLDEEHTDLYRRLRDEQHLDGAKIPPVISKRLDIAKVLRKASKNWDGAYALIGVVGNGDAFVFRDPCGIRPCYYILNEEVFSVASERAALMTIFDAKQEDVHELEPGHAIIVKADGTVANKKILTPRHPKTHCSFERIYFSRGNDPEIYAERKALGAALVDKVNEIIHGDIEHSVFSYVPNTAETAFYGLIHEFYRRWRTATRDTIAQALDAGILTKQLLDHLLLDTWPRSEKIAHKDIKLRTFISGETSRKKLASHVYDVSYGTVRPEDNLVVLDDSIVRGTTLKQSIIRILSRLNPKRIIICSTAPQVRYPDCYGIDMSELGKFLIFKAAVKLCYERKLEMEPTDDGKTKREGLLTEIYHKCKEQENKPATKIKNYVRDIYKNFSVGELSDKAAELVRPPRLGETEGAPPNSSRADHSNWDGEIALVFQSIDNLHKSCPTSLGDWYFTGEYPTPGGYAVLNRAYTHYYEGKNGRAY
jgi:amidophosphoribosyltransferase